MAAGPEDEAPQHRVARNGRDGAGPVGAAAKADGKRVGAGKSGNQQHQSDRDQNQCQPRLPGRGRPEFEIIERQSRLEDPDQARNRSNGIKRQIGAAPQPRDEALADCGYGGNGMQGQKESEGE